jgi:hypothetical protein
MMADAAFWRKRKEEFRDLAKDEYLAVPDPADDRRLHAYGSKPSERGFDIYSWKLNEPFSADFRTAFEEAASLAGSALDPPQGAPLVEFWLHRLFQHLLAIDKAISDRGHLGIGGRGFGVIRDVCTASAMYCSRLAQETLESSRSVARRHRETGAVEDVRIRARQMLVEGATHRQVCERLKEAPRPTHAEWRHLSWDRAYKNERYRSAVCKWLSRNCRP